MSIAIDGRFLAANRVAAITARASEPTNPAIGGGKCTPPSGFMFRPSSLARSVSGSAAAGANGACPRPVGDKPSARWCIAVLPTTVMSQTCLGSMPWRSYSTARAALTPSRTTRARSARAAPSAAWAMRLITSSPYRICGFSSAS